MKKTILKQYARLLAVCGVAVKKGDPVIIQAGLDQPEFVAMCVDECYKAGASRVMVEWDYQPLAKLHVRHRTVKSLGTVEEFERAKLQYRVDKNPAMLYLLSDDPDGLKGINQEKLAKAQKAKYGIIKPYRDAMDNKYKWCIAAVPGEAWAKKVFPGVRTTTAVEKLWEAILFTSRVIAKDGTPLDPVVEWHNHNESFANRCAYLNSLGIKSLEYKSANGTNFTVGLMPEGIFCGGSEDTLGGETFNPNIPSEEIFTSPKSGVAEGLVVASLPLSYKGELIENFSVRFEGGKVVEVKAEKGEELLKQMVGMDEGAARLGECAFVPYNSPIRESGITFFETLFDENAACHLALGRGFSNCVKDYDKYTLDELTALGVNESMIHVDFMIGTADLEVTAVTADDKRVVIFKDGVWAF
ncbi:MAG: aminopeptidase [Ruminococcaceae bacterium]|nr:aminopeptidase [Oscillospiraceae bacterium]